MIELPGKAIIGVVHLPALPGTPANLLSLISIIEQAKTEAVVLSEIGFDAIIVENFGDTPFRAMAVEPHITSAMTLCVHAVVEASSLPVGVNVLRNDPLAGLAIAASAGGHFIRVNVHTGVYATDQGIIQGRAFETLEYRRRLNADIGIVADVHVKHAQPLSQPDIVLAAEETAYRGKADALVVSGTATGRPADMQDLARVKQTVPDRPVFVGSGITPENVLHYLEVCDGVIVGSCIKKDGKAGNPLDLDRAQIFIQAAKVK